MYLSILKEAFIIWEDSCFNVLHKINIVYFLLSPICHFHVKGIIYMYSLKKINIISEKEKEKEKEKDKKRKRKRKI